jgi:hypothetical protein
MDAGVKGDVDCLQLANSSKSNISTKRYFVLMVLPLDYRFGMAANGKAEPQRRVGGIASLDESTKSQKAAIQRAPSGREAALPPLPPLRTVRASLDAHGSSISNALRNRTRFPNINSTAMNLPVAIRV